MTQMLMHLSMTYRPRPQPSTTSARTSVPTASCLCTAIHRHEEEFSGGPLTVLFGRRGVFSQCYAGYDVIFTFISRRCVTTLKVLLPKRWVRPSLSLELFRGFTPPQPILRERFAEFP
jgi:hypothetical protein